MNGITNRTTCFKIELSFIREIYRQFKNWKYVGLSIDVNGLCKQVKYVKKKESTISQIHKFMVIWSIRTTWGTNMRIYLHN